MRTGLLSSGGCICDASIDGAALLDIAWGVHDEKLGKGKSVSHALMIFKADVSEICDIFW